MKTTIFYPLIHPEQEVARGLTSSLQQKGEDISILVFLLCPRASLPAPTESFLCEHASLRVIEGTCRNMAELMNSGIKETDADILVHLQPNIELESDFVEKIKGVFRGKRDIALVYTDYAEVYPQGERKSKKLRDVNGDITERVEIGFVKAYSKKAVEEVGMFDEHFNSAEEYDLRLKFWDRYTLFHLDEELYRVYVSPEKEREQKANVGASKLFFPGEGKYGGFSYLFYDEDEEREIEEAFESFQKRQYFYLSHKNSEVVYDDGEQFSPLVSVVIPVYNRVRYIEKAINSVFASEFQDFEIIVVDNGSTDGSIEVVEKLEKKNPEKITLLKNDKNIIAYSLNLGVRAAKGKYISQLDSDDEYTPQTLRNMTEYLETHPNCALAISYYDLIDEHGEVLEEFGIIKHLEYSRNNIMRVDGAGALRMWHKKVILEFGGFNEDKFGDYGEDYDMVLRVSEKYDICRVHHVLYHYRRHPDNTDIKRDPEMKIINKLNARHLAMERRKRINRNIAQGAPIWD